MKKLNRRLVRASGSPLNVLVYFLAHFLAMAGLLVMIAPWLQARTRDKLSYGEGLIVNIPFPEAEVEQIVQDVAQNGIIRGTKEYNKDKYVTGAKAVDSTKVFPKWTEGGKVFYKVKLQALDPRNFKESGDLGTLGVRYVLQPQGDKNTVLRINAVFVEDFRKTVHASNGSVEGSEYKDIRDHLEAEDVMNKQTVEAEKERQQLLLKKRQAGNSGGTTVPAATTTIAKTADDAPNRKAAAVNQAAPEPTDGPAVGSGSLPIQPAPDQGVSAPTLEQHVKDLRRQVERLVKAPGAPLKSAPFHTASTLSPLTPGTEVLILISTPYWYGVETRDGQHGWVFRDEVEALP
ncbi:MAG TPA: hypothetical protein VIW68_06535 [Candidatus Sulfotelmatobacter sp.]